MRKFRYLLGIIFLLGFSLWAISSYALPRGNYFQSCQYCVMLGNTLTCTCKNKNNIPMATFLPWANRCGFVQNSNGKLTCSGRSVHRFLPPGNYRQSCRRCRFRHGHLKCRCQNRQGGWQRSELRHVYRCRSAIKNKNGYLTCRRHHRRYWTQPRGSYRKSCFDCSFNGRFLVCRCTKANGQVRTSMLRHAGRCNYVVNRNGHLRCA